MWTHGEGGNLLFLYRRLCRGQHTDMTATIVTRPPAQERKVRLRPTVRVKQRKQHFFSQRLFRQYIIWKQRNTFGVSEVVFRHIFRYRFRKDGYTAEYAGRYKEYHRKHRTDGTFAEQYSGSSFAFFRYGRGNA